MMLSILKLLFNGKPKEETIVNDTPRIPQGIIEVSIDDAIYDWLQNEAFITDMDFIRSVVYEEDKGIMIPGAITQVPMVISPKETIYIPGVITEFSPHYNAIKVLVPIPGLVVGGLMEVMIPLRDYSPKFPMSNREIENALAIFYRGRSLGKLKNTYIYVYNEYKRILRLEPMVHTVL